MRKIDYPEISPERKAGRQRFQIKDLLTKPRTAAAVLLAGLALAGCGVTKSADKVLIGNCGDHAYSQAGTRELPDAQVLATAKRNVLNLQRLALRVGGAIDLPRYGEPTNSNSGPLQEVTATEDNLRLNFDRSGNGFTSPRVDHIDFPISGNTVHVSIGALMCVDESRQEGHQWVVNGTYASLQSYAHQTAPR